jgi:D-3-phosphoglycerate dehydrogenase
LSPYFSLAEQLGRFAAQLATGAPDDVEIVYSGGLAHQDASFLTRTVIKGLLWYRYQDEVNYVNAPLMADSLGIRVREVREAKGKVFTNLISLKLAHGSGTVRVAGTLYNGFGPRIVEVDGYAVDAPIEGSMLFTRHTDQPGMIGRMGTILGDAGINIAGMQVGRRESGGEAIMILSVDKPIPKELLAELTAVGGIRVARGIDL